MPSAMFQGISYDKLFSDTFESVAYARDGFTFGHDTEAGVLNFTKPVNVIKSPKIIKDHRERELVDALSLRLEASQSYPTIEQFRKIYLLSKGNHSLSLLGEHEHVDLVPNTNLVGLPNGSQAAGLSWTFLRSNKESKIDLKWETLLTRPEILWLKDQSVMPFQFQSTVQRSYGISNVLKFCDIKISGESVPVLEDVSIEISSVAQRKDYRDRPINRFLSIRLSFPVLQSVANDLIKDSYSNEHQHVSLFTDRKEEFRFLNVPFSLSPAIELSGKDFYQTVRVMGRVPYNGSESMPDNIDFGVRKHGLLEVRFI